MKKVAVIPIPTIALLKKFAHLLIPATASTRPTHGWPTTVHRRRWGTTERWRWHCAPNKAWRWRYIIWRILRMAIGGHRTTGHSHRWRPTRPHSIVRWRTTFPRNERWTRHPRRTHIRTHGWLVAFLIRRGIYARRSIEVCRW